MRENSGRTTTESDQINATASNTSNGRCISSTQYPQATPIISSGDNVLAGAEVDDNEVKVDAGGDAAAGCVGITCSGIGIAAIFAASEDVDISDVCGIADDRVISDDIVISDVSGTSGDRVMSAIMGMGMPCATNMFDTTGAINSIRIAPMPSQANKRRREYTIWFSRTVMFNKN